MIKGYYINAKGDAFGIEQGETVSINGLSLDDGHVNPELGEDFFDSWGDDFPEDFREDDYDFPWDENGESFEDWLDEVL